MKTNPSLPYIEVEKVEYILGLLFIVLLCTQPVRAGVIYEYQYQGNDYTSASTPYTTSMAVSGDFTTVAPLSTNLDNYIFTPLAFSFTDGVFDLNNLDTDAANVFFKVSTDALGNITGTVIDINLYNLPDFDGFPQNDFLHIYNPDGDSASDVIFATDGELAVGQGANSTPGQWTSQTVSSTPEPASISLLLTGGLAGLWLWKRKNL